MSQCMNTAFPSLAEVKGYNDRPLVQGSIMEAKDRWHACNPVRKLQSLIWSRVEQKPSIVLFLVGKAT